MRSTPVGGGLALPLPASQGEDVFLVSVFLPIQMKRRAGKSSEGLAPFVALDPAVARPFQPTSFGRRPRKERIRRSVIPPRLMSRGSGPDVSAPTAGK
jgi:hypothetical protein